MNDHRLKAALTRAFITATAAGGVLGLGLSVGGLVPARTPGAAAAASGGSLEVVNPTGGAPLTSGGSATDFRFKLPVGSACTGDSANAGYRIQSFLIPQSVALDTLKFDTSGPVPVAGQFRAALFDTATDPYVDQLTAMAVPAGGPGAVIQPLPAFNFGTYNTTTFPITPGAYTAGIACTLGPPSSATQLDKYWRTGLTITADPADTGPAKISFAVSAVAPSSTTTLAVTPAASAASGTEVTLTATVVPEAAAGTVTFKDGTATLGTPVTLTSGTATLKRSNLSVGAHSFTASFTPTSAAAISPSTSETVAYTITGTSGSTTSTSGSSTTTTTTITTTTTGGNGSGAAPGSSGSITSGGGSSVSAASASGQLPKSGTSTLPLVAWAFFLVCFGRAAVLLGRQPPPRSER